MILHFKIRKEQIWIWHNGTEEAIGDRLVGLGVPKDDIILGFQPPEMRPYTGFGTGMRADDAPIESVTG
jgi:hypothetical protein